ncbi:C-Maf-inducing protein-like isoform X2 [Zootermopsis nevadensis]|uniref:C-Maf-inducing protein-like isoform X2 n=1 Tax=Zootermopsis nevadensis TaxID=136037 RepID=UPI000B8E854B|nr:C-Maf-inducing protein-like isoform X2 [Zootermopsis nevadensis]
MFCFSSPFGRRDRSQFQAPASTTDTTGTGDLPTAVVTVESATNNNDNTKDDESCPLQEDVGTDVRKVQSSSRWKKGKRNSWCVTGVCQPMSDSTRNCDDVSTSSNSSTNNSRISSLNRHIGSSAPPTALPMNLVVNKTEPDVAIGTNRPYQNNSKNTNHHSQLSISGSTSSSSENTSTVAPPLSSLSISPASSIRQSSVESSSSTSSSGSSFALSDSVVPSPISPTVVTTIAPVQQTTLPTSLLQTTSLPIYLGSGGTLPAMGSGPRFKPLHEGDIQVCYLNHTRTVVSKILSSKFLRRWESHHLYLNDSCISSKTANNAYTRDQWFHSIIWKKNIFKYRSILKRSTRPEVILKELKSLVDFATATPLQDECVTHVPIEIVSELLVEEGLWSSRASSEELITMIAPLLDNNPPTPEMCHFFSNHCVLHPRSPIVADKLTPIAYRILKRSVDFSKSQHMRHFVQDYIRALYSQNAGEVVIKKFVSSVHGPGSGCPHPRVLPNLVAVCLAAIFSNFEERRMLARLNETPNSEKDLSEGTEETTHEKELQCYVTVLLFVSEYDDWRPVLAQLLQPIPFPTDALAHEPFIRSFRPVIECIGTDARCSSHQMVQAVRKGKEGWFHVYCPSSPVCTDDGQTWGYMLKTLLHCCCRCKWFLSQLTKKQLGACLLLALRGHSAAQEALCLMLEWELIEQEDQKMQLVSTLQSTASGRDNYAALCQRQLHLRELQQKGGPRKLTLPSRSTDADIARLLSCGSFGNLEVLSLAFTHVTSACAEQLIKLPSLKYLNLWATQFSDTGLLMISEHLHNLQVLNLCETPVSDKGITALSSMTNLRKLNLNSTKLSAQTFEVLKQKLPALQEFDVRYTEAW